MNLFAELKRRNVLRAAVLYAGAVWALAQGIAQLTPVVGAPEWIARGFLIAACVGFPFWLAFAWFYELTPQGLKRESEIAADASITRSSGRKLDRAIIVVLAVAVVLLLTNTFVWKKGAGLQDDAASAIPAKSVAVLPFVNMSGDPKNAYFSEGISEEILNVLARTPDLRVAARTSSFSFKDKAMEVPDIARALNVRMVLEGSVRKQGDRVRITAQLIDGQTDLHVWSQTYDRQLKDIFAIQDEIATSIGNALQVKLADVPKPGGSSAGTTNLKAYDLYLRGIALWQTRREDALWQAIGLFEQATQADPRFAQAYAGEALTYAVLGDYSRRIPYTETLSRATNFAERALALDPSLPEPYAALAMVATRQYRRATADALFSRAIALRPSFAPAWQWRGSLLYSSGDLEGGLAALERASTLDPRSSVIAENHAFALRALGRDPEARAVCMRILAFAYTNPLCLEDVAMVDLALHDYDGARSALERMAASTNPSAAGQGRELVEALTGDTDGHALAVRYAALPYDSVNDPASGNALSAYDIPGVLILLGEHELAMGYLERLVDETGGTADWTVMLPAMDPIRCTPRFKAVIAKLKTTDPHAAKVCGSENGTDESTPERGPR